MSPVASACSPSGATRDLADHAVTTRAELDRLAFPMSPFHMQLPERIARTSPDLRIFCWKKYAARVLVGGSCGDILACATAMVRCDLGARLVTEDTADHIVDTSVSVR